MTTEKLLLLGAVFFCLRLFPQGGGNGWRRNTCIAATDLLVIGIADGLVRWWLKTHPEGARWIHDMDIGGLVWLGPLVVVELGFWLGRIDQRPITGYDKSKKR